MSQQTASSETRHLRLLSLDGGGVRGLSNLLILRRLMYLISPCSDFYQLPKPCDYFDYIAGTSTGGLIALLLGRLELDVQTCIDAYVEISQAVFQPRLSGKIGRLFGRAMFSAHTLHSKVDDYVQKKCGSTGQRLQPTVSSQRCRVFVNAVKVGDTSPIRLRTYPSRQKEPFDCDLSQAACATAAAPTFFDPVEIKVGSLTYTLADGGLRNNNPTEELIREVEMEFDSPSICCIVSIGTGVSRTERLGSNLSSVAKACAKIATDTEEKAAAFREREASPGKRFHNRYFRFNVEQGLQDIGMHEYKKLDLLLTKTDTYLDGQNLSLQNCVEMLKDPIHGTQSLSQSTVPQVATLVNVPPNVPFLIERPKMLAAVDSTFASQSKKARKTRCLVLTGIGGSGKTQLAIHYAQKQVETFAYIVWFDCRNLSQLEASVESAASILPRKDEESPDSRYRLKTIEKVVQWFEHCESAWLFVFDNLDDLSVVESLNFMPQSSYGQILITSRNRDTRRYGKELRMLGMETDEAWRLFCNTSETEADSSDRALAVEIMESMKNLPLGISLIGAYVNQLGGGIKRYHALSAKQKASLTANTFMLKRLPSGYPLSLLATWKISLEQIAQTTPLAMKLLYTLSCIPPELHHIGLFEDACETIDVLPVEVAKRGFDQLTPEAMGVPEWLLNNFQSNSTFDELNFDNLLIALEKFNFLRKEVLQVLTEPNRSLTIVTFDVHPVLLELVYYGMNLGLRRSMALDALTIVCHALPDKTQQSWDSVKDDEPIVISMVGDFYEAPRFYASNTCVPNPIDSGLGRIIHGQQTFNRTLHLFERALKFSGLLEHGDAYQTPAASLEGRGLLLFQLRRFRITIHNVIRRGDDKHKVNWSRTLHHVLSFKKEEIIVDLQLTASTTIAALYYFNLDMKEDMNKRQSIQKTAISVLGHVLESLKNTCGDDNTIRTDPIVLFALVELAMAVAYNQITLASFAPRVFDSLRALELVYIIIIRGYLQGSTGYEGLATFAGPLSERLESFYASFNAGNIDSDISMRWMWYSMILSRLIGDAILQAHSDGVAFLYSLLGHKSSTMRNARLFTSRGGSREDERIAIQHYDLAVAMMERLGMVDSAFHKQCLRSKMFAENMISGSAPTAADIESGVKMPVGGARHVDEPGKWPDLTERGINIFFAVGDLAGDEPLGQDSEAEPVVFSTENVST